MARKELVACLLAIVCFGDIIRGRYVKLHTDNDNAYQWLKKGLSTSLTGTKLLALWELVKYTLECKISPVWIPLEANRIESPARGIAMG